MAIIILGKNQLKELELGKSETPTTQELLNNSIKNLCKALGHSNVQQERVNMDMFQVILNATEKEQWNKDYDYRCRVADAVNSIGGDLGGWGIDLEDESGNDLSVEYERDGDHVFSYGYYEL